jgi:hypothetical protein
MDVTTASPEDLKRLYDHIAVEMSDDRFFTTKELALLPKIMASDEWLYGFSSGYMNNSTWLIVLTSKRVIFLNKNLLWGHEETSVGLGKINSVQKKAGIVFGNIMLHDGSREYAIRNVWKKSIIPFTNRLDRAIEEFERSARSGVPIPAPTYPWDAATPSGQPAPAARGGGEPEPLPEPEPARESPVTSIEMPPAPPSGPLRAYMDSLPDASPPPVRSAPAPRQDPAPAPPQPVHRDDPVAARARLDRMRDAGAITPADHDRMMREIGR